MIFAALDLWSKEWAIDALSAARGGSLPPVCEPSDDGFRYMQRLRTEPIVLIPDYLEFRYAENCNGSRRNIAGILNASGNVLGMMPHPERAIEAAAHPSLGGSDGRVLFESAVGALVRA